MYLCLGDYCHQCHQKTRDLKTTCHNENCNGVQGQVSIVMLHPLILLDYMSQNQIEITIGYLFFTAASFANGIKRKFMELFS